MSVNASFAGNSIQTFNGTNGIILQQIHHAGKNAKQAQTYAMSHANQSVIPYVEFPNKPITLIGEIVGSSIADCDNQIDNFMALLLPSNAALLFDYNGGSLNRKYVGTFTNIDVQRPDGLGHAAFTATFTATTPFGSDTSATTPTLTSPNGRTNASYQDAITFGGNAPYQLPIITVTCVNPLTSSTNLCTVGNNGTFETGITGWSNNSGTSTQSNTFAHSGTNSMKTVNAASATNGIYGWVYAFQSGLTPGQTYTVSVWLRGAVGGESVTLNVAGGTAVTTTMTTSWQQVIMTFIAQSSSPEIDLWSTNGASSTWYADDMTIYNNTSATISLGNDSTGQLINITRVWSAGDVLVVDPTQLTVTVNGNLISWTGAFPVFAPGAGTLDYFDNFTSRTFNIGVSYTKLYL